tara:strand:- start:4454 stop:4639 length:186 start_codon:yes stop_codon:yes gene_type:complete
MPLITRLDSRSVDNSSLNIKDEQGKTIAVISCNSSKAELSIDTIDGLYIEKPNGFSSKKEG